MVSLLLPREGLDELDGLIEGSLFFVGEFAGFVIVVLDFCQQGGILGFKSKKSLVLRPVYFERGSLAQLVRVLP